MDAQKSWKQGALCDDYMGNLALAKSSPKPQTQLHLRPNYVTGKREVSRILC